MDNGRQFISRVFEDYCQARKIQMNFTGPYWPQSNGEAERQNRSLFKWLRIGRTPSSMMGGITIRNKIPTVRDIEAAPPLKEEVNDQDAMKKRAGKRREDNRRHARPSEIRPGERVLMKNMTP